VEIYNLVQAGTLQAHLLEVLQDKLNLFELVVGETGLVLGEGAALATAMVPFLLAAIMFSYFGLQRRAWQQGGSDK
jgi:multiple sugar transport system permease protein